MLQPKTVNGNNNSMGCGMISRVEALSLTANCWIAVSRHKDEGEARQAAEKLFKRENVIATRVIKDGNVTWLSKNKSISEVLKNG